MSLVAKAHGVLGAIRFLQARSLGALSARAPSHAPAILSATRSPTSPGLLPHPRDEATARRADVRARRLHRGGDGGGRAAPPVGPQGGLHDGHLQRAVRAGIALARRDRCVRAPSPSPRRVTCCVTCGCGGCAGGTSGCSRVWTSRKTGSSATPTRLCVRARLSASAAERSGWSRPHAASRHTLLIHPLRPRRPRRSSGTCWRRATAPPPPPARRRS